MIVAPLEGSLAANSLSQLAGNAEDEGPLFAGSSAPTAGDNISRFIPPWLNEGSAVAPYVGSPYTGASLQGLFGPLMGMLTQLMQMMQSLMGYSGCSAPLGSNGSCGPYGSERFFQNATGSSEGDPHLTFNESRWTSMASQPDLLNSDSFVGGYRLSTQVTQPNGRGVTWNQSATVSLSGGATSVTLNSNGQATITRYGQTLSIARGQTLALGDGESATYDRNGALSVTAENGSGGRITTTLTARGKGVDVDVTAHDVDLGGELVNGEGGLYPGPAEPAAAHEPGVPVPEPFPEI